MESQLRKDCQTLVKQLQTTQHLLNKEIAAHVALGNARNNHTNLLEREGSLSTKSAYARSKLLNSAKVHSEDNVKSKVTNSSRSDFVKNKENIYETITDGVLIQEVDGSSKLPIQVDKSVDSHSRQGTVLSDNYKKHLRVVEDNDPVTSSSWQPATPNTQRRRMIIDRHTHVPTRLDEKELRDLNNERRLNFSYSHVGSDDDAPENNDNELCEHFEDQVTIPKSSGKINQSLLPVSQVNPAHGTGNRKQVQSQTTERNASNEHTCSTRSDQQTFKQHLEADGNNRKLNTFIRDTTIKPKSLLNSTTYSLHNLTASRKNNSGVRFDSSRNTHDSFPDQRLLGYDWIAALLDNNSELMDQSESFFNELREFRRAYKDECSNQFYMEGPHTLVDYEPEVVAEALREPKVEPYIVNERLFTEPLKTGLINYEEDDGTSPAHRRSKKKPTADNPRFVRVSIPRSTLQAPHRMRPHRRRSFDASDSCSLMDHCLLGWENTVPSVIPTAKSVDLNTAAGTCRDYQKMTLAEAERMALTSSHKHWAFDKPHPRLQLLPIWKKHYMESTLNMSVPAAASINSSSSRASGGESLKRTTDKMLNSAYLTMYEMERLKEERRLGSKMRGEEVVK